jgi:hypothetical protein
MPQKKVIRKRGAKTSDQTPSGAPARRTSEQGTVTRLSNTDRDLFLAMLDQKDLRPNRTLLAAARKYKRRCE